MLHIVTEIGKPGRNEREKRHFPHVHNKNSSPIYSPRGRRYISHGSSDYNEWRPHGENINVKYSYAGPDWESKLRYIPDPENPKYPAAEIFPNNWHAMRPYPYTYQRSGREWLLDPDLTKVGLRCVFGGEHRATSTSSRELTHQMIFGRGRTEPEIDKRNGILQSSLGDKSYQVSEYSPEFHKLGSTLPVISFGTQGRQNSLDTFVPLQPLPAIKSNSFLQRQKKQSLDNDMQTVRDLDGWRPATPLYIKATTA
ncbi:hypothetical protein ScPMuIL_012137 [Solemya velum]